MEINCLHCNSPIETNNKRKLYCSDNCKVYHHRELKKPELNCNFCGEIIKKKSYYKFCCDEHKKMFFRRKRYGKTIMIKVDSKTVIETKQYDKIPEIIKRYKENQNNSSKDSTGFFDRKNCELRYVGERHKKLKDLME